MNEIPKAAARRQRGTLEAYRLPIMIALAAVAVALIDTRPLWPGMLAATVGEAIQVWAASQLRKDKELATSGPYAHVRNPMYFGRFFVGLGVIMMIHNVWITTVYAVCFVVYVTARVGREEARLRGIFGEAYDRYCSEVRRFLPRLIPYRDSAGVKAQWSGVVRNHEYRNVLALFALFALICARVEYLPALAISRLI